MFPVYFDHLIRKTHIAQAVYRDPQCNNSCCTCMMLRRCSPAGFEVLFEQYTFDSTFAKVCPVQTNILPVEVDPYLLLSIFVITCEHLPKIILCKREDFDKRVPGNEVCIYTMGWSKVRVSKNREFPKELSRMECRESSAVQQRHTDSALLFEFDQNSFAWCTWCASLRALNIFEYAYTSTFVHTCTNECVWYTSTFVHTCINECVWLSVRSDTLSHKHVYIWRTHLLW